MEQGCIAVPRRMSAFAVLDPKMLLGLAAAWPADRQSARPNLVLAAAKEIPVLTAHGFRAIKSGCKGRLPPPEQDGIATLAAKAKALATGGIQ